MEGCHLMHTEVQWLSSTPRGHDKKATGHSPQSPHSPVLLWMCTLENPKEKGKKMKNNVDICGSEVAGVSSPLAAAGIW